MVQWLAVANASTIKGQLVKVHLISTAALMVDGQVPVLHPSGKHIGERRIHRIQISSRRRLFLMTQMKEADSRGRPLVPPPFCDGCVPALLSCCAACHSDDEWLPSAFAAEAAECDSHAGQTPACVSLPPLPQTLTHSTASASRHPSASNDHPLTSSSSSLSSPAFFFFF